MRFYTVLHYNCLAFNDAIYTCIISVIIVGRGSMPSGSRQIMFSLSSLAPVCILGPDNDSLSKQSNKAWVLGQLVMLESELKDRLTLNVHSIVTIIQLLVVICRIGLYSHASLASAEHGNGVCARFSKNSFGSLTCFYHAIYLDLFLLRQETIILGKNMRCLIESNLGLVALFSAQHSQTRLSTNRSHADEAKIEIQPPT